MCRRKWIISAILAVTIIAVFGGGLIWMIRDHRMRSCEDCAKALYLRLMSYRDAHEGCLPPPYIEDKETGERHSWRAVVLPHVVYEAVYKKYDFHKSPNSPENREVAELAGEYFACPVHSESSRTTNYIAVIGDDTLWPEPKKPADYEFDTLKHETETQWPAPRGRRVPPGGSQKVLFVEIVKSDIPWNEPRDITLDEFIRAIKESRKGPFYNAYAGEVRAVTAGGELVVIDPEDDEEAIRRLFVVEPENVEAEEKE